MKLDLNLTIDAPSNTLDWVKQSRKKEIEKAKKLADDRARAYDEEENEKNNSSQEYSSQQLKGMKILHSLDDIIQHNEYGEEGVILTLADTNILKKDEITGEIVGVNDDDENDGIVLENIHLTEENKRRARDKQKKRLKQPLYAGYDDEEFEDNNGDPRNNKLLLSHYDVDRKAKKELNETKITLGEDGLLARNVEGITIKRDADNIKFDTLEVELKPSNEFLSEKEVKFKTKKSNSNKKKGATNVLRQLVKEEDEEESNDTTAPINTDTTNTTIIKMEINGNDEEDSKKKKGPQRAVVTTKFFDDEDDIDLSQALRKARDLANKKQLLEQKNQMDMAIDKDHIESKEDDNNGKNGNNDYGAMLARTLLATDKADEEMKPTASTTEELYEIDAEGRRYDGKLVFNSTMEFSTRLQARLNERARLQAEQAMQDILEKENNKLNQLQQQQQQQQQEQHNQSQSHNQEGGTRSVTSHSVTSSNNNNKNNNKKRKADSMELGTIAEDDDKDTIEENQDKNGENNDMMSVSNMGDEFDGNDFYDDDDANEEQGEKDDASDDEQMAFLHDQPMASKSMASALQLLKNSGDLRRANDLYGRAKDRREVDPSAPVVAASEKEIKIEYRDKNGRKLTQKEAYRQLCYNFHGYGPSAKKKEKRMKAMDAQQKSVSSRSGILEGSGGMMKSLTTAQEATGKAHVIVQGGEKASSAVISSMAKHALKNAAIQNKNNSSSSSSKNTKK